MILNFVIACTTNNGKDFLDYLSGFLTPVIALIAICIGWQQMNTQRYKAKFDLFERRMSIYESIRAVLLIILRDSTLKNADLLDFYKSVRHSKFLFNRQIQNYISDIDEKVVKLEIIEKKLYDENSLPVGEERNKVSEDKKNIIVWLTNQIPKFEEKFTDFMTINKI